jgi:hypothetical protein
MPRRLGLCNITVHIPDDIRGQKASVSVQCLQRHIGLGFTRAFARGVEPLTNDDQSHSSSVCETLQ